jgi:hypothetical protein
MAFSAASGKFQLISPGRPKLWLYSTTDANAVFEAASYFDSLGSLLTEGDMILVAGTTGGTQETSLMVVRAVGVTTTIDLQVVT